MNTNRPYILLFGLILGLSCRGLSSVPSTNIPTLEPQATTAIPASSSSPIPSDTPGPIQKVLPEWAIEFDEYIQETMSTEHIPGLAYALILPDGTIYAQGYGFRDVAQENPVTPNTLFHIASTQKSMNSMLVAVLIDAGYFDWDTPLVEIYPDFQLSNPEYTEQVTMRHLLSMSSGIPDFAEDNLDVETASPSDVLLAVASTNLLSAPGNVFNYSNLSATMAGYIAGYAHSGGQADLYRGYVEALRALVLEPIGMTQATFSVTEARSRDDFSYSYTLPNGVAPQLAESYDVDEDPLAPAGSLKANVLELAAYIATQINSGVAPNGTRIVSAENLRETWRPVLEGYALGWENLRYNNSQLVYHTGSYDNYVSVMAFLPEEHIGLVILINSEDAGYDLTEDAPYDLIDILRKHGL
ncbi:MAG: serine hydrolase domain-containing protein [Anaerolineae bacterium]|nr:serine hydrolase domain-containing protein [Anaerolineae bacterium]